MDPKTPTFFITFEADKALKSGVTGSRQIDVNYITHQYITGGNQNQTNEPTAASELLNKFYPYVLAAAAFGAVWLLIPKR